MVAVSLDHKGGSCGQGSLVPSLLRENLRSLIVKGPEGTFKPAGRPRRVYVHSKPISSMRGDTTEISNLVFATDHWKR